MEVLPTRPFPPPPPDLQPLPLPPLSLYTSLDKGIYGEDFGLDFHLQAVEELARVTKKELRIANIHTWNQTKPTQHPYVSQCIQKLGKFI